jgi:endonuclease III
MKNVTKRVEELKSLLRKLLKARKPEPMQKLEPLAALVRGALSANVPDAKVEEVLAIIGREFVDLNELRVATELEMQELLGARYPGIEQRATFIAHALNDIFEREHTLNLERLKTLNRKDVRQFIHDLPGIEPFVEAYVMLFAFEAIAVPVDQAMLDYLIRADVIAEGLSIVDAQKFLENHLKSGECYDFYVLVRGEALGRAKAKSG